MTVDHNPDEDPYYRFEYFLQTEATEQIQELLQLPGFLQGFDWAGRTPLIAAMDADEVSGRDEMTRLLLRSGADPNQVDSRGIPPLNQAAGSGRPNLVEALLQSGANPRAANLDGMTALMYACKAGSLPIVQMLVNAGAEVRALDNFGRTALSWAVVGEDVPALVRFLLQFGFDLEACDAARTTVLNIACSGALAETAKVLIEAGANVNAVDEYGTTPLMEAAAQPIRFIRHDQSEPEHPREEDVLAYRKIVQLLLDAGADPCRVNAEGLTAEMITKDPITKSMLQRAMST